jgi:hypothetical protein
MKATLVRKRKGIHMGTNVLATLVKTFISRHCGGIVSDKSKKKDKLFQKKTN